MQAKIYKTNNSNNPRYKYVIYFPTTKAYRAKYDYRGTYVPFTLGRCDAIRLGNWKINYSEPISALHLGKPMDMTELPLHVQKWIQSIECLWNHTLIHNTYDDMLSWHRIKAILHTKFPRIKR